MEDDESALAGEHHVRRCVWYVESQGVGYLDGLSASGGSSCGWWLWFGFGFEGGRVGRQFGDARGGVVYRTPGGFLGEKVVRIEYCPSVVVEEENNFSLVEVQFCRCEEILGITGRAGRFVG